MRGSGEQVAVSSKTAGEKLIPTLIFVIICLLLTVFLATVLAQAQRSETIPVIGLLGASSSSSNDRTEAFRQGLRELQYVEGKNILIER